MWWSTTSSTAAAQKSLQVALHWDVPDASGCASEFEIRDRVARLTDRPLASRPAAKGGFAITAALSPQAGSWRADITLVDAHHTLGTREVLARIPACRGLDVPVALVIATLVDDLHAQAETAAMSGELTSTVRPAIGLSATGAFGIGPRTWFGTTLVVDWPLFGMIVPLDASVYLPVEQTDDLGRGTRSMGFHAGAAVCPHLVSERLELRLCGGLEIGGVWATGVGLTENESGVQPLLLVGIEPKLVLGITKGMALQLSTAAQWVAVQPSFGFEVEGRGRRLEGSRFALLGKIGIISFLPW